MSRKATPLPELTKRVISPAKPVRRKATNPLADWGGADKMMTSYNADYCRKESSPTNIRPCSNTRRNRPHPSKYFMNWRLPSKPILGEGSGCIIEPNSLEERYVLQNFYEEYKGKIDDPLKKFNPEDENIKLLEKLKNCGKPIAQIPISTDINNEQFNLVTDLLSKSSPQEQEILEKAFGSCDPTDPSNYTLISPEAIKLLEQVLKSAGITDKAGAVRFLLSVGQVIMSLSCNNKSSGRITPAKLPKPPTERKPRSPTIRSPDFLKQKHKDRVCSMCKKAGLNNTLRRMSDKRYDSKNPIVQSPIPKHFENVPRLPRIPGPRRHPPRTKTWHTMPNYPPQGKVENKLATFVLPHRAIPRSFTIHPEWS